MYRQGRTFAIIRSNSPEGSIRHPVCSPNDAVDDGICGIIIIDRELARLVDKHTARISCTARITGLSLLLYQPAGWRDGPFLGFVSQHSNSCGLPTPPDPRERH
jgi:hypothetical protein